VASPKPALVAPDPAALAEWQGEASIDPRRVAAFLTVHVRAFTAKRVRALARDNAPAIIGREWPEARTVHAYRPETAARVVAVARRSGGSADPL
jgi:hypothetical protein